MHVLIVGGSGMLKAVTQHYIGVDGFITLIARNKDKMEQLKTRSHNPQSVHVIAGDYIEYDEVIKQVEEIIKAAGKIDMAILWIHASGNNFRLKLNELLIKTNNRVKIFELTGSVSSNPVAMNHDEPYKLHHDNFRKIILGQVNENGQTRWLTHQEICKGTLEAINNDRKKCIIGTVAE